MSWAASSVAGASGALGGDGGAGEAGGAGGFGAGYGAWVDGLLVFSGVLTAAAAILALVMLRPGRAVEEQPAG